MLCLCFEVWQQQGSVDARDEFPHISERSRGGQLGKPHTEGVGENSGG